jgi:hypothetical protein
VVHLTESLLESSESVGHLESFREVCGSICASALNVHDRSENKSGVIRESTARNSSINASERVSTS